MRGFLSAGQSQRAQTIETKDRGLWLHLFHLRLGPLPVARPILHRLKGRQFGLLWVACRKHRALSAVSHDEPGKSSCRMARPQRHAPPPNVDNYARWPVPQVQCQLACRSIGQKPLQVSGGAATDGSALGCLCQHRRMLSALLCKGTAGADQSMGAQAQGAMRATRSGASPFRPRDLGHTAYNYAQSRARGGKVPGGVAGP